MKRTLILALLFFVSVLVISLFGRVTGQVRFSDLFGEQKVGKKLLLPDMVSTAPKEILIRNSSGKKILRFSTTFYNQGKGPLELVGHTDKDKNVTYASQYVYEEDGPGLYKDIGSFVYHPLHSHWHVDQYVFYELWSVKNGNEADRPLITTDKMSFCIWDEHTNDLSLENAPQARVYARLCNRQVQGMSVGWGDTYSANIEGQEVDIQNVPDGNYIFRTIINPDKKIEEANYENNQVDIVIEIKGNILTRK